MGLKITGKGTSRVEVLNISREGFWIYVKGQEFFLSFEDFPWFKEANLSSLLNIKLLQGEHLYWPQLDVDLELDSVKSPRSYPLMYT